MSANGRVCIGFSYPRVAAYHYSESGDTITYSDGMPLARGVDIEITPDEQGDDNNFSADNRLAEYYSGVFTGGELKLTVDGLLREAAQFIYGLPAAGQDGFVDYDDNQGIPNVGFGYITTFLSDGAEKYVPTIVTKVKFKNNNRKASTMKYNEDVEFQTQELTAKIMRGDNAVHTWLREGNEYATEAAALAALDAILNVD